MVLNKIQNFYLVLLMLIVFISGCTSNIESYSENSNICSGQGVLQSDLDYCAKLYVLNFGNDYSQSQLETSKDLCNNWKNALSEGDYQNLINSLNCKNCGNCENNISTTNITNSVCPEKGILQSDEDYCTELNLFNDEYSQAQWNSVNQMCDNRKKSSSDESWESYISSLKCESCGICNIEHYKVLCESYCYFKFGVINYVQNPESYNVEMNSSSTTSAECTCLYNLEDNNSTITINHSTTVGQLTN
jgi:hypothetical protein